MAYKDVAGIEIGMKAVLFVTGCRPDSLHVVPPQRRLPGGGDLPPCHQAVRCDDSAMFCVQHPRSSAHCRHHLNQVSQYKCSFCTSTLQASPQSS
jgi:hypothetical protein